MIREITKVIFAVLQNPKFIALAKNISNILVVEDESHIAFFLSKTRSEDSQIIQYLRQLIPSAVILTDEHGKPFLNIALTPELVSKVEGEVNIGREQ